MNETDLYQAIGELDDDLLQEAELGLSRRRIPLQKPLAVTAACALVAGSLALCQFVPGERSFTASDSAKNHYQVSVVKDGASVTAQPLSYHSGLLMVSNTAEEMELSVCRPDTESEAATYDTQDEGWEPDEETLYYAYLDLEEADEETQEKILAAREEIIYHHSWVAEGCRMWIIDEDDNIVEELPQFSDLFPDWDVPCHEEWIEEDSTEILGYCSIAEVEGTPSLPH